MPVWIALLAPTFAAEIPADGLGPALAAAQAAAHRPIVVGAADREALAAVRDLVGGDSRFVIVPLGDPPDVELERALDSRGMACGTWVASRTTGWEVVDGGCRHPSAAAAAATVAPEPVHVVAPAAWEAQERRSRRFGIAGTSLALAGPLVIAAGVPWSTPDPSERRPDSGRPLLAVPGLVLAYGGSLGACAAGVSQDHAAAALGGHRHWGPAIACGAGLAVSTASLAALPSADDDPWLWTGVIGGWTVAVASSVVERAVVGRDRRHRER